MHKRVANFSLLIALAGAAGLLGVACSRSAGITSTPGSDAGTATLPALPTPADIWLALLAKTPAAYTTPQPEAAPTPLDGVYAKIDPSWPQWWLCRRCADYRPAGGIWKLQFERGVMRIYYDVTGWSSLASYTVSGDRLRLFNDPYCNDEGVYRWTLNGDQLVLVVEQDACSFSLRGRNLGSQPWDVCPPGSEAAQAAPGCEHNPQPDVAYAPTPRPPIKLTVTGGDSRFFDDPPDLFAIANRDDRPAPEGIRVDFSPASIPYGLNRVLWWQGNWIEAQTELPFTTIGVQFLGSPPIGWARVLFDGIEVWRGDTAQIWSKAGVHGGISP